MTSRTQRSGVLATMLVLAACTPTPRPAILEQVARTRDSSASKEAERLAPQAFLHAEQLRRDADKANEAGDRGAAEALGEHALAAYAHAEVLARLAKADLRQAAAEGRVQKAKTEFNALEAEQRQIAAEAADTEARVRVARDALPLAASEPSTPERERARLLAARALSTEARLLCLAAQMAAAADSPGVTENFRLLDSLDAELAKAPPHPSIDTAIRLRSACLGELTRARMPTATGRGEADALLDELARGGVEPHRDDRGVVVVLRDAFQGTTLKPAARDRVALLAQVARAHTGFPVLVVGHTAKGPATARDRDRVSSIAKLLTDSGATRVQSAAAGDGLPVADPRLAASSARNERIEVVFVAPAT